MSGLEIGVGLQRLVKGIPIESRLFADEREKMEKAKVQSEVVLVKGKAMRLKTSNNQAKRRTHTSTPESGSHSIIPRSNDTVPILICVTSRLSYLF